MFSGVGVWVKHGTKFIKCEFQACMIGEIHKESPNTKQQRGRDVERGKDHSRSDGGKIEKGDIDD